MRFASQHVDARPDEVPDGARNWLARLSTALPIIGQLKNYRSTWLLSDATAGLAIAAVALPTAVAYPAIAGLPVLYREPFVLRVLEGWSYEQIGEALRLPKDTVETRLVRARRLLRERLQGRL